MTNRPEISDPCEVDEGLVAIFLKLSPEERLLANDQAARAIWEMRNAFRQKSQNRPRPERHH